jgi:hypothetical protein
MIQGKNNRIIYFAATVKKIHLPVVEDNLLLAGSWRKANIDEVVDS